ncbi:phage head maturation protease [Acetobacter nitrogenifigens DSM 23921 = NBRC 105050]|uniref:Prohead serine protease domain-containing protein n=1 Tax=Acetobacter nitrogenifigens DSM 23921 = NBRC 105050 TaxID=1120919 RepID=A0A511XFQ0_9PROT|nr:HK97 family phage prohead protease [Acetobacter nitrogenifigens]GBQ90254.1 phage head maturation protease [Acetobacter nitrogenifigens DSM 23921 = NBRC 105050]GEN61735.1 hypothetical protein ANI02nite_36190 [Acetobacter nitrogenifigens DSM 23921 = NBRC 105050]
MIDGDYLAAPFEVKFAPGATDGTFEGYGSVFNNTDAHGDVVLPGAFADSLAERKSQGRSIAMHVMHGFLGGDGLPAGVWTDASEDSHGLHLKGKLSGMDTDYGKRLYGLVKDGALSGLSIGFSVPDGGAIKGTQVGEPRRQLKRVNLHEVSLVDDPSNAMARVTDMKRRLAAPELRSTITPAKATDAVAAAIQLHQSALVGGDSPTQDERDALLQHLQAAHEALTGAPLALDGKAAPLREIRAAAAGILELLGAAPRATSPFSQFASLDLPDLSGL